MRQWIFAIDNDLSIYVYLFVHFKRLNVYLNISNPGGGFEFTLGSCASSYSNKTAINSFRENIPLIKVLPPHFKILLMVKSM